MENTIGLSLQRAACGLILALFAQSALAAAGTVMFVSGEATVDRGTVTLPVEKGLEVDVGDLLATGYDGRIQIRMGDGQWIALFPNTRFKIDEFRLATPADSGTATVRKAARSLYSLLRGGFRTITNSNGRLDASGYRVRTPVATLGIRGTTYAAVLDNGLYIGTEQGAVSATNEAGTSVINQDQFAFVKNSTTPVEFLTTMPEQLASAGLEPAGGTAAGTTTTAAEASTGFFSEPLVPILGAIGLAIVIASGSGGGGSDGAVATTSTPPPSTD